MTNNEATPSPLLSVRDLRVSFGAVEVLHGVDLNVRPGVIHALIGESGSGKSVLARSILGLAGRKSRTTGSIRFEGRELVGLTEKEYRAIRGAEIGMVVQDAMSALNPMRTIGEQLVETIRFRHPDYRTGRTPHEADLRDIALSYLKTVGITAPEKRMDAYAHQLSGGMRQRIMIALALVGSPKLLLADEPTTALDVVVQRELLTELRELVLARGMSMLLVTHDLHLAHDVADDVSVMYAGNILEEGPVGKVIPNPAHPYTEGLLNAMPDMTSTRGSLTPIPGEIPPPDKLGSGCPFASRCARATERCRTTFDAMKKLDDGHWQSRCTLAHEAEADPEDEFSDAGFGDAQETDFAVISDVRVKRHCENAQAVAEFLEKNERVAWVNYCGLKSNKYYELGQKYLPNGSCGVIAFGLKGTKEDAVRFMDSLKMVAIVTHVADARTCVLHPASHTHRQLSDEQLREAGIAPDLIRLSVGIEDVEDILDDIRQALDKL